MATPIDQQGPEIDRLDSFIKDKSNLITDQSTNKNISKIAKEIISERQVSKEEILSSIGRVIQKYPAIAEKLKK